MKTEIRFAGLGGQGLVSASILMAEGCGVVGDYQVVQTQFYGVSITGGASCGDVVVSDVPIALPWVLNPDLMVVMAQEAVKAHAALMNPGTTVLADDLYVTDTGPFAEGVKVLRLPLTRTADEVGLRKCANMVALGATARMTGLLGLEDLLQAVAARAPGKPEINAQAVKAGYNLPDDQALS